MSDDRTATIDTVVAAAAVVDQELQRMLGVAGIDGSHMDPASAQCLRALILQQHQDQHQRSETMMEERTEIKGVETEVNRSKPTTTQKEKETNAQTAAPAPKLLTPSSSLSSSSFLVGGRKHTSETSSNAPNISSSKAAAAALTRLQASATETARLDSDDTAATTTPHYDLLPSTSSSAQAIASSSPTTAAVQEAIGAPASHQQDGSMSAAYSRKKHPTLLSAAQIQAASTMSLEDISTLIHGDDDGTEENGDRENEKGEHNDSAFAGVDKTGNNQTQEATDTTDNTNSNTSSRLEIFLTQSMQEQRTMIQKQTEIMVLLNQQIQDMSTTLTSLKDSVHTLEQQKTKTTTTSTNTNTGGTSTSTRTTATLPGTADADIQDTTKSMILRHLNAAIGDNEGAANPGQQRQQPPNTNTINNNPANPILEAHREAHSIAWRIVTFPFRAMSMYIQYEYRLYIVLLRLIRRDVLEPLRRPAGAANGNGWGGMLFQLGFAVFILYSRLGPVLEKMLKDYEDEHNETTEGATEDDDDDYYTPSEDDDTYDASVVEQLDFDNPTLQLYAMTVVLLLGLLYRSGVLHVLYKFVKHKMHYRIAKDLINGVELTPEYGLQWEQQHENNNNNNNNIAGGANANAGGGGGANANANAAAAAGNANNNNNNNRGGIGVNNNNAGDGDGGVDAAVNRIWQALDEVFLLRRGIVPGGRNNNPEGGAPPPPVAAAVPPAAPPPQRTSLHLVIGFIIDCIRNLFSLLYSFVVSILPIWNPEEQLQQIREDNDRRVREEIQQAAEQLRVAVQQRGVVDTGGRGREHTTTTTTTINDNNDNGENEDTNRGSDSSSESEDTDSDNEE